MAYIVMAYIGMTYIVRAYTVMAYIVMAYSRLLNDLWFFYESCVELWPL